jgi:hypothetical protein
MEYKGYKIDYCQPLLETQGIDNKGNPVEFRDSTHFGHGWYQAYKKPELDSVSTITASDFERIKQLIDRELAK